MNEIKDDLKDTGMRKKLARWRMKDKEITV